MYLKTLILAAALCVSALAQRDPAEPVETCDRRVDVAVVGAGVSGAYASYLLMKEGLSIELVEATNRVGGRHHTINFPDVMDEKDLTVELGAMMYANSHERMKKLIQDLGLHEMPYPEAMGIPEEPLYYIQGKHLKQEDINAGNNIPFNLNNEEKQNAGRIVQHYFEKLTSKPFKFVPKSERLNIVDKDGVRLYQMTIEEALSKVASEEGKKFFYAVSKCKPVIHPNASALLVFGTEMDFGKDITMWKIKEGMMALPEMLVNSFLTTSNKHRLSMNRTLESIEKIMMTKEYMLHLRKTRTENGITYETGSEEFLCAKKVILAIPKEFLMKIWTPILRNPEISKALDAVRTVPESKVIMSFKSSHWTQDPTTKAQVKFTDESIGKIYNLGTSPKDNTFVLMASYAEGPLVKPLQELNLMGTPIQGSAPGFYSVSTPLKEEILNKLKKIFNVEFKDPERAISKFWMLTTSSTVWRANNHFDDVISRIQRPSLSEEVHIVGGDFAWGNTQSWTEGALDSVEKVLSKYFFKTSI